MRTSSAISASGRDDPFVPDGHLNVPAWSLSGVPVMTVGELLTDHLRDLAMAGNRTSTTIRSYRSFVDKWIGPRIGDLAVGSVQPADVRAVLDAMSQAGRSASSVSHVRTLLRASFERAREAGVIESSPLDLMDAVGRGALGPGAASRAPLLIGGAVLHAVLEAAGGHPMTDLAIRLAVVLGQSRTELVALQWSDIDMETRTVGRPARLGSDASVTWKAPVVVDAPTFRLLERTHSRRAAAGVWVISSDRGLTPWSPGHLSNRWAIVRARVPDAGPIRLDDLRRRAEARSLPSPGGSPIRTTRTTRARPAVSADAAVHPSSAYVTSSGAHDRCPTCLRPLPDPTPTDDPSRSALVELRRSLTRREDAVASLAALGLTNSAIALRLFVSVKAVEFHLTHVFQKFGILNRTQLSLLYESRSLQRQ